MKYKLKCPVCDDYLSKIIKGDTSYTRSNHDLFVCLTCGPCKWKYDSESDREARAVKYSILYCSDVKSWQIFYRGIYFELNFSECSSNNILYGSLKNNIFCLNINFFNYKFKNTDVKYIRNPRPIINKIISLKNFI